MRASAEIEGQLHYSVYHLFSSVIRRVGKKGELSVSAFKSFRLKRKTRPTLNDGSNLFLPVDKSLSDSRENTARHRPPSLCLWPLPSPISTRLDDFKARTDFLLLFGCLDMSAECPVVRLRNPTPG